MDILSKNSCKKVGVYWWDTLIKEVGFWLNKCICFKIVENKTEKKQAKRSKNWLE